MAARAVTADGRTRLLADGNEIPLLGLGVALDALDETGGTDRARERPWW